MEAIAATARQYILDEFLPGENPAHLTDSTPLISGGILDSLATLRLVAFLEEQYGITLDAHEVSMDRINTIADIAKLVQSKLP